MLVKIIGMQDGEIVAMGEVYENGVKYTTLKMYLKAGLLHNTKIGTQYALSARWLKKKYEAGEIAWVEA